MNRLSEQLNSRKELWKYYEVTYQHVKDWKNTSIKKVNLKTAKYRKLLSQRCSKFLDKYKKSRRKTKPMGTRSKSIEKMFCRRRQGLVQLVEFDSVVQNDNEMGY